MPRTMIPTSSGSNRRTLEHSLYDFRGCYPTTGNYFFVDSNAASGGNGYSPEGAVQTLNAAVALCTANNGDIILVMEGHAETLDSAADVDLSVAGIRVIGLGHGNSRPTFTWTAAAATFAVGASSVWVENILFVANFTNGVTEGVDIDDAHTDVTFKDCEWRSTSATKEFLKGVTIAASAARITFDGCFFYETGGGDATAAIFSEGALDRLVVKNCEFDGTWTAAVIDIDAGTAVVVRPRIINNICYNSDTGAGLFCTLDSTVVGFFVGNRSGIGKANTVPVTDASASVFIDNLATDAAAISELKYPATATAWA